MIRAQRWIIAVIIVAPVLVMAVLGYIHVRNQVNGVLGKSEWIVADAISRQIGREVRIGKAGLTPLGKLVLQDVAIAQGPSFSHGKLATARQVAAAYDYFAILFQSAGASGIGSIEIVEPRVWLVRQKDGILNISDLLKPKPGPPGPPFVGTVKVVGGTAIFRDTFRMRSGVGLVTIVRGINADFDARGGSTYRFDVSARSSAGRFLAVRGMGVYNRRTKGLWFDASGAGIDAVFAARSIGLPKNASVSAGIVDFAADGSLRVGGQKTPAHITGVVRLDGLTAKLPGLQTPIQRASGVAVLSGESAMLDLTAAFAGVQADVKGSVSGFRQPLLNLAVSTREIRVREFSQAAKVLNIPPDIKVDRINSLSATITGTIADPRVEAVASVPEASIQKYRLKDIQLSFGYSRGVVDVRSAELNFNGARVQASGTVGTGRGTPLDIKGKVRDADLGRMPIPANYRVNGKAEADFTVCGTAADPALSARAVARNLRVQDVALGLAEGMVTVTKRGVLIRHLRTSGIAGGSVAATGTFDGKRLDLHVSGSGLQLASVGKLVGQRGLSGVAYVSGSVTGPVSRPVFEGLVEGFGLKFQGHGVEYVRAAVSADQDAVNVKSAMVRWFPAEVRLSGRLSRQDKDHIAFQASGQAERLNLDRVFETIGRRVDVTGTVGGDFVASGVYNLRAGKDESPLKQTEASGTIRLQDGTAFRYPVDDAQAQWTFRNNVMTLSETVIASEGARLTLGGNLYVDKRELDLDFGVSDLDFVRLRGWIPNYVSVSGKVNASGIASGPWNAVRIDVKGGVQDLVLNQMAFDQATLQGVYSGDKITSAELDMVRGKQQLRVSMSDYSIVSKRLGSGSVDVIDASIPDLWEALKASPYLKTEKGRHAWDVLARVPKLTGGTLNASAKMSGPIAGLDGALTVTASGIGIDVQRIETLEITASAEGGAVYLKQLKATSGATYLQASGSPLYKDGNLNLALSVNNFGLDRLKLWLKGNTPSGTASVELEATGKAASPNVTMSVEVVNPGIRGYTFDRLRAGRIDIGDGKISFPDPDSGIILASANHQIVAHGYVPWSWSTLSVPSDQRLEVATELNNQDLSILSSFVSDVDPAKTKGPIEVAAFRVEGTLAAPTYDGILQIKGGNLALKGFSSEFQDVNVDLAFDGNRILVNKLSAKSSLGGIVAIVPGSSLAISGNDAEVKMLILANGLTIAERSALGFKETLSMHVDAGLTVTGSLKNPLIADADEQDLRANLKGLVVPEGLTIPKGIIVSNALLKFAIPGKSEQAKPFKLPINPRFNIGFDIGRDVKVQPPNMNLVVGGSGSLTGKYNDPSNPLDLTMEIMVQSGSLYLAASRLRVAPGSTLEVRYVPPGPPDVTLKDFIATTTMTATSQLNRQERYEISLSASGKVSDMGIEQIDLTSKPPGLSRQRMLAALGHVEGLVDTGAGSLQGELASVVTATATSTLFRPIERVFTEQLGFEQFSLEYSPSAPLSLYVSTRVFGSVYISYFQRLQAKISEQTSQQYVIKASWLFRQFYEFSVAADDQGVATVQIGVTKPF